MDYDADKIKEAALALLYVWSWQDGYGSTCAWKEVDWELLDALHERGAISDPKANRKYVSFTEEGLAHAQALAAKYFAPDP